MIPSGAQISISNIAWPAEAEEEALALVSDLGFRGLELAPGKVFSHRNALEEARSYRGAAEERGLEIVAFQAILFGDLDVALFGTDRQRRALAEHLAAIARLAGAAGAGACVFGAPGARRRNGLEEAKAFAHRLRARGCRFALDDFGAGFGSFSYLKTLPFDYFKIDGDFIRGIVASPMDQLVVGAIVGIAQGMGKKTIAEFVTDDDTAHLLEKSGVDYAQGYHFGRPRPLRDVLSPT